MYKAKPYMSTRHTHNAYITYEWMIKIIIV